MQWNMVLDPKGCSSWNWYQNAMITIDTIAKAVKYQGQYFAVKHFSYYVKPGAKKIKYSSNFTGQETFQNPDGSIIVVSRTRRIPPHIARHHVRDKNDQRRPSSSILCHCRHL